MTAPLGRFFFFFFFPVPEGLQAIQLEDGSTAYIAHPNPEALFTDGTTTLDAATIESLVQAQVRLEKFYYC